MKKYLLTLPLLLVTSVALAGWKSNSASVEEAPVNEAPPTTKTALLLLTLLQWWQLVI